MSDEPRPRLLIVDDEPALMRALCETLQAKGYDTVGFTSAHAALDALRGTPCDVLLADLMMPEMDGISLLGAAREVDPSLVCVIMTGQGSISRAVQAMQAGAFDFILKPFNLAAVMPVLTRALSMRSLHLRNKELSDQVQRRTLELEAANKELESFSYSVSHDLRAPLRWIAGFANALEEDHVAELSAEARRKVGLIRKEAHHMGILISELLEFSHLGRQEMAMQEMDMHKLATKAWDSIDMAGLASPVKFRLEAIPNAHGDRVLVLQVWVNLLSNAVKFSSKCASPEVVVTGRSDAEGTTYTVQDNGAGFDPEYQSRLFRVFQRLHDSSEYPGNGVGLALVQRIVNRHGGQVWAQSKPNEGASFSFSLPRRPSAQNVPS